jgi:hypothetical protein
MKIWTNLNQKCILEVKIHTDSELNVYEIVSAIDSKSS